MTAIWIVLLALAVPLWIGVIACLFGLNQSDAAGNGLAEAFTALYIAVLWAMLSVLLWIGLSRTGYPGWTIWAALLLHPASCAAAFALLYLQSHRDENRWMIAVPALAPPLLMLIAACGVFPALPARLPANVPAYAWGAVLCLSLVPWPRVLMLPGIEAAREAQREAVRMERKSAFDRLTTDTPIVAWMAFTEHYDDTHYEAALAAMRGRPNRQIEIEEMLAGGDTRVFRDLAKLDLEATPTLCRHARTVLAERAAAFHPSRQPGRRFHDIRTEVESYESALEWLAESDCRIDAVLRRFEGSIRAYPDWDQGALILAHFERLQRGAGRDPVQ